MHERKIEEVPFLSNVGLMMTYKCTVACPHCIVKAGPHRREEMKISFALEWLNQIKSFRNGFVIGISLTGGEPFYNFPHLIEIADHANSLGFIVSVVTNAFWASSKEEALRILKICRSINMFSVSTDLPHQVAIPFENARNAIWAAKKLGKLYNVAVATESEDDPEYLELIDNILEFAEMDNISTSYIMPVGRAAKNSKSKNNHLSSDPPPYACPMASFPVIFPNGKVIACIGPPITMPSFNPLYLGNLQEESIHSIFERAESNYVLHAVRTFGPKVLVDLLKEHGYADILPHSYMKEAICDICYKLFSKQSICLLIDELIRKDESFRKKTAYGRYYYMNEASMVTKGEMSASVN